MLPESFLNELKYKTDIEQVISRYVQLRRRGRNLTGLGPFHSEKTPSFTVYPDTQSFYCFGCGAGGDAITFVKKAENLDYMEAVRALAERAGLTVPEGSVDDSGRRLKARVLELNRAAARHFHQNLMSDRGREARGYLVDRGLTKATVVKFGIGYAPESWDDLRGHLRGADRGAGRPGRAGPAPGEAAGADPDLPNGQRGHRLRRPAEGGPPAGGGAQAPLRRPGAPVRGLRVPGDWPGIR